MKSPIDGFARLLLFYASVLGAIGCWMFMELSWAVISSSDIHIVLTILVLMVTIPLILLLTKYSIISLIRSIIGKY